MSVDDRILSVNEWVMSLDNPTRAKYEAHKLWKQGIRSDDRTIIQLQYGYNDHDTNILCDQLKLLEAKTKDYNPDLGF